MTRAVLSVGSNLGDRLGFLQLAVDGFSAELVAVSPVYETAPWGVLDQGDFLNAVLIVQSDRESPEGWLARGQELERRAGRVRTVHWGPRTLDVDVVHVPGVSSDDPHLTLPHPGAGSRATVLIPWLDCEPDAVLPEHGRVSDLVAALSAEERAGVRLRDDLTLSVGQV
ncbi:MAG: 2-amino-4-hydroxy-6-hydroxymethyldihydropteridine diphosphokinase [Micromonosporaceae bacterium]